MKRFIRGLLWKAYYYFDFVNCLPHFSKVRQVDNALSSEIIRKLQHLKFVGSVVVIATYNQSSQSRYINYLISKLNTQLVIVVNNTDSGYYKSEIVRENVIWVDRPNYLRDIGAYRLAVKAICQLQITGLERVILMNDSIYVLREDFFKHILQPFEEDVVSHSFSENPAPHLRSYLLSIRSTLLSSLDEYLQKIPPTKSRYAAINMGELGMSQHVFLNHICRHLPLVDNIPNHNLHAYGFMVEANDQKIASNKFIRNIAINKLHYYNESLDPYEMKKASNYFIPAIIKRELYEKGLATREQCLFWIKSSDIPEGMHNEIICNILLNKRQRSFVNLLKRKIGEI